MKIGLKVFTYYYGKSYETSLISHTVDLTGTVVETSSRVVVFSGIDCNILNRGAICDHFIEQLPPISGVDTAYVVPPYPYSIAKIRIIAIDNSSIFYKCAYRSSNII